MGYRPIAIDGGDQQRARCMDAGAEIYLDFQKEQDLRVALLRETGGKLSSAIIVCAGVTTAYEAALDCLDYHGTLVAVGIPPPTSKILIHPLPLIDYGIRIIGSITGHREDIAEAAEFVRKGLVKPRVTVIDIQDLGQYAGRVNDMEGKLVSNWYDTWTVPNMTVSFFAATEPKVHRHLRSRVSSAYSMSSILSMEPFIQEVASELWGRFREFSKSSEPVPLHSWANYFAFDVVGQLALGGRIGFVEHGEDIGGIIKSIHDGFYLMANMGNVPLQMLWFNNSIVQWILKNFGGKRLNSFNVFLKWLDRRVTERMTNGLGTKRRDMLQHFVEAKDMSGQPVKKGDVMIEGVNILGAGADTTSIGILAVMGAILTHPAAKEKLCKELDQAYKDLGLEGTSSEIDFKDAEKLPYLAAVVKESMRLHPSISYQLPRVVPEPGIYIGEHFIKPGSICSISATSMNRSKEVFGPDAEEWKPERWIPVTEYDQSRISTMNGLLTTFGMGARSCVGKNIALVEVHKFIAQFFRHFDAIVTNKERPWATKSQWFSIQKEFWVTIKERGV
ncbi:hypothetical protein NECHADRAFT_55911 [Paecilomyces variotii No. 5]|uniref:Alcohol dehydrogenase-like C-terminal domain-containing protein n=1 Tax=Byssochlamys spectabilis (strain No. 5 / NBRC 109023) TaxID=1356009 RepID=V5GGA0_BYSSN|nr:hypothetical protein NECHADRAFT_55911 [Paecilomyces variotii No. 5]